MFVLLHLVLVLIYLILYKTTLILCTQDDSNDLTPEEEQIVEDYMDIIYDLINTRINNIDDGLEPDLRLTYPSVIKVLFLNVHCSLLLKSSMARVSKIITVFVICFKKRIFKFHGF